MDMGENAVIKGIIAAYPVGTKPLASGQEPNTHSAPVRLHRVSTTDPTCVDSLNLFDAPFGRHAASPLYAPEKRIVMGFDTFNGKLGAWRYESPGHFAHLWTRNIRNSNQPLYFPDTGEVIVDDVHDDQRADSVVLDLETGEEKGRVYTNTMRPAAMVAQA